MFTGVGETEDEYVMLLISANTVSIDSHLGTEENLTPSDPTAMMYQYAITLEDGTYIQFRFTNDDYSEIVVYVNSTIYTLTRFEEGAL